MTKKKQQDLFTEQLNILTVADYIALINSNLEVLSDIKVEGEVSEFRVSQGKWVTFKLKSEDGEAIIDCFTVIFKLDQPVEDGMKIRVQGRPRIYPKYGKFSISVEDIELAGAGSLKRAFELTKKKLEAEGLFAPERKRQIPEYPKTIGLITSSGAAAYTDFVKVLENRFGGIKIYFYNARVQGKGAIGDVVEAFDWFDLNHKKENIELVVLTRGGGAMEDLQAFNSEEIARSVFSSNIPVVCGVGHERDETLVDFVADLRASTPSNAAELIIRDKREVLSEINGLAQNVEYLIKHEIEEKQAFLGHFSTRTSQFINEKTYEMKQVLITFSHRVKSLSGFLAQKSQQVDYLINNNIRAIENKLGNSIQIIAQQSSLLKSYSPKEVLKRGYSIVTNKNGKIIKNINDVVKDEEIETTLSDGKLISIIKNIQNS